MNFYNKLVTETVLFNNIIRMITVVCQNSILTPQETMQFLLYVV